MLKPADNPMISHKNN